ncbi:MAG: hypothetical protein ABJQ70_14230, partial [Roseobacter sp.]
HKTVLPALPALVPSSPNPPILKGIESANGLPIKEEFFNTISSEETFAACAPKPFLFFHHVKVGTAKNRTLEMPSVLALHGSGHAASAPGVMQLTWCKQPLALQKTGHSRTLHLLLWSTNRAAGIAALYGNHHRYDVH